MAATVGTYLEGTCFFSSVLHLRLQQYTDHVTGQLNIVETQECCKGIRIQESWFILQFLIQSKSKTSNAIFFCFLDISEKLVAATFHFHVAELVIDKQWYH